MAKFDGKKLISALEYDFTSIPKSGSNGKTIYCKGKGFIPEPTDEQIDEYRKAYAAAQAEAQGLGQETIDKLQNAETEDEIQAALGDLGDIVDRLPTVKATRERLVPAIIAMTGGHPTEDQIKDLPSRALRVFAQWLFNEVNDPNSASAATRS